MKVSIEDIRRQYAELSDEGLLEIEREDLVEQARQCYDEEMARRRLKRPALAPAPEEIRGVPQDLVVVAEYLSPEDGHLALELLRGAGIAAYLGNEHFVGTTRAYIGMPLRVPAGDLELARELLESQVPEEKLATAAGASYIRHGVGAVRHCIYGRRDLLDFVRKAFDAVTIENTGGHVEIMIADSVIMLELSDAPRSTAARAQIYVYVPDVDAAYDRALEAGVAVVTEPGDLPNDERTGSVKDPFGNTWHISIYKGA
jgi:PhnB protein